MFAVVADCLLRVAVLAVVADCLPQAVVLAEYHLPLDCLLQVVVVVVVAEYLPHLPHYLLLDYLPLLQSQECCYSVLILLVFCFLHSQELLEIR